MDDLIQSIDESINIINHYADLLLINKPKLAKLYMPSLSEGLNVITNLVKIYDLEVFAKYREDQTYWINQLQRILNALERDDYFAQYDVLVNETIENLKYVRNLISEVEG